MWYIARGCVAWICEILRPLEIYILIYLYLYISNHRAAGFALINEKKCSPGFQLEKLKSSVTLYITQFFWGRASRPDGFFVRVPFRNALVTHGSTKTRAGIGDLRAWQSPVESLLHGLVKFRGLNRRAKAGESLVLTDGENCVQRISSELIAVSLSPKSPLITHFLHRYG